MIRALLADLEGVGPANFHWKLAGTLDFLGVENGSRAKFWFFASQKRQKKRQIMSYAVL